MKNAKFILVFILAFIAMGLFAQNANVSFKDNTNATLTLVRLEDPAYPNPTPVGSRWVVRAYLSTDAVIDPLSTTAEPTGDDTYLMDIAGGLIFGPGPGALAIGAAVVPGANIPTYVYLRIFNSVDIATATKYMTFHTPYNVAASGPVNVNIIPTYGWFEPTWQLINPIPDNWTYTLNVNGPAGYMVTGPTINGTLPYVALDDDGTEPNALLGMYTAEAAPAGFHWEMNPIEVTAADFAPAKGAKTDYAYVGTIEFVLAADPDTWTYTLNVNGPDGTAVTGPVDGILDYVAVDNDGTEANALLGMYTAEAAPPGWQWMVNPIEVTAADFTLSKGTKGTKMDYAYIGTIEFVLEEIPPVVVPVDPDTYPGFPAYDPPVGSIVVAAYVVTWTGVHDLFIPANIPPETGALAWWSGAWHAPDGTPDWTWLNVNFDLKGDIPVVVLGPPAVTPVELSSFTATLTGNFYVKLTWVSQSETNLLGYRVYRSESSDQASATMITPTLIPATNTSTMQTYTLTDSEVNVGTTYYYWLESVDYGTSTFHGPVNILVEGEVPPEIPTQTILGDAYPNPFIGSTNIVVTAKEAGTLTIYNILGQAVYQESVTPGIRTVNWNGKDKNGKACGSGIYFYKLSTPSMNQTKKMVIVK